MPRASSREMQHPSRNATPQQRSSSPPPPPHLPPPPIPTPPLSPPADNAYGTWAASGEIDILECRGQAGLADVVEGTLHYGGQWPANTWTGSGRVRPFPGLDYSATFHDFALEWTSNLTTGRPLLMRWLVDGTEFYRRRLDVSLKTHDASPYTQDGQPWDKRFHLILNLAVGGGFFPAGEFGEFGPSQWDAAAAGWQKPRLEIDHLKVWAWPPPG